MLQWLGALPRTPQLSGRTQCLAGRKSKAQCLSFSTYRSQTGRAAKSLFSAWRANASPHWYQPTWSGRLGHRALMQQHTWTSCRKAVDLFSLPFLLPVTSPLLPCAADKGSSSIDLNSSQDGCLPMIRHTIKTGLPILMKWALLALTWALFFPFPQFCADKGGDLLRAQAGTR